MNYTVSKRLKKPEQTEFYNVDDFNANADTIDACLYALEEVKSITLLANAWSGASAPFAQTVSVPGIRVTDKPILVSKLQDGADMATAKAYNKAFACIASGTGMTADGSVTFKVYKKPTIDITVGLKGV